MNTVIKSKTRKYNILFIHILLWGVFFVLPNFFIDRDVLFRWDRFVRSLPTMLGFMVVFYINYFYLIDKFLFKGKKKEFLFINLLIIALVVFLINLGNNFCVELYPNMQRFRRGKTPPSPWLFIIRNSTSLMLMSALSVALKMSTRWFVLENERKEMEKAIAEAELQNLKNQISPHFLLNTLNNIYALIEFNPAKAQSSLLDLSKMLRHLLYENNKLFVPLHQEVDFIKNYFHLMQIRMSENVQLKTEIDVKENSMTPISPLIFISLIENAFKHGISGNNPSFINISLSELPEGKVKFVSRNSYFPKTKSDKSGSGIGLELVRKRLDLLYPNRYTWNANIEDNIYTTELIIDTNNNQYEAQLLDN